MAYLRRIVEEGGRRRYGERPAAHEDLSLRARAWQTIDRELDIIEQLGFAGYFLVVWDLVEFCRRSNIYCQGRGSAANSAVCYALGVTAADAVSLGLLFERFLSPERDGPPDIDIDIESDRREEVIQYVYAKHGRHHTAQVANVITYRARSAIRDMAKALGYAPGQQDAWAKRIDGWGTVAVTKAQNEEERERAIPDQVLDLAAQVEDAPRHLGIHSGGMVICDRPVIEVCPVEWGRMADRSVLQWDKDDCAAAGLVKFDLLGLGMLSALHYAVDLVREHRGYDIDLAKLPQEDEVYAMLCRADTVGVFQIESRAQMATLPRLKPRRFYDLVVEVALIRPGPIQGGSVHPYIRRRNGQEPVTYLHPLLENSLGKTLGVPLFQEQLMQMAIDVAGFTPAESDELRQAMGSKRSAARMERLRERLYAGMAERGITGDIADQIFTKMKAFANYGFPESHSVSFAYLVYASSWIKFHEPAAFCAALLNAQPMGFWSPHSLVRDARRHGVEVRSPDLNKSLATSTLEPVGGALAVRIGLQELRGVGKELAAEIERRRTEDGPYRDPEDLARRVPELTQRHLETMATAGVFGESFGLDRRRALWAAGAVAQSRPGRLAGIVTGASAPQLPLMNPAEEAVADLWSTGITPDGHPTQFLRGQLDELGVLTSTALQTAEPGSRVKVAGVVTHRQRPMTAQGITFLNLEDETGLVNIVVSKGCWARFRRVAQEAPAMLDPRPPGALRRGGQRRRRAPRTPRPPRRQRARQPRLPLRGRDATSQQPWAGTVSAWSMADSPSTLAGSNRATTMSRYVAPADPGCSWTNVPFGALPATWATSIAVGSLTGWNTTTWSAAGLGSGSAAVAYSTWIKPSHETDALDDVDRRLVRGRGPVAPRDGCRRRRGRPVHLGCGRRRRSADRCRRFVRCEGRRWTDRR